TVSSWSSASWLKVDRNGETVLLDNTKRVSFLDFVDLPRHTSQPLELALYLLDRDPEGERRLKQAEKDAADRAHLESHGWRGRASPATTHAIAARPVTLPKRISTRGACWRRR